MDAYSFGFGRCLLSVWFSFGFRLTYACFSFGLRLVSDGLARACLLASVWFFGCPLVRTGVGEGGWRAQCLVCLLGLLAWFVWIVSEERKARLYIGAYDVHRPSFFTQQFNVV
jgi:hypothetical protein